MGLSKQKDKQKRYSRLCKLTKGLSESTVGQLRQLRIINDFKISKGQIKITEGTTSTDWEPFITT